MNPANPVTAIDHLAPDSSSYGKVVDGPHAGTFAKIGIAARLKIGAHWYRRFEVDGSGVWEWRLESANRSPAKRMFNDLEWDEQIEAIRNHKTFPQATEPTW